MSPDQLQTLSSWPLAYIATPYSKWPHGIDNAFEEACKVTARLFSHGVRVFSPIVHSHSLAIHGNIDPLDHEIWLAADRPFMEAASGLIVVRMPGWQESYGVAEEMRHFAKVGKPIEFVEWKE